MKTTTQLIIFFISSIVFAQLPVSLKEISESTESYYDYKGSIYNTINFIKSSVIHEKSGKYDAELRYNIHTDALELKRRNDIAFNIIKSPTTHARLGDDYFYYCEFKTRDGIRKDGYYILVELNENYKIYKRHTLKIIEPKKGATVVTSEVENEGKIIKLTRYYIEEGGVIIELPMKKKQLLSVLGDEMNKLKAYIKKEKIRLRKEEDLIRLVSRYNAIKNVNSNQPRSLLSSMGQSN